MIRSKGKDGNELDMRHVLRMERTNDCTVAMEWQPEGKRKVEWPNIIWRRTVKKNRSQQEWASRAKARGKPQGRAGGRL